MKNFSTDERQMKILKEFYSHSQKYSPNPLRVNNLAFRYGVSEVTIRKDLAELENLVPNLERFHGGARLENKTGPYSETLYSIREKMQSDEKRLMAKFVEQKFIRDEDYLLICPGSTTTAVAREIAYSKKRAIRCVSTSLTVALEFAKFERDCEFAIIGGFLHRRGLEFVQIPPNAFETQPFRGDFKAIMTASGFSIDQGATNTSKDVVNVKWQYINAASEVYMIMDYSKFTTKKASLTVTYCGIQDEYDEEEERNWLKEEKDFWLITMPPIKRESDEEKKEYDQFMSIIDQYRKKVKPEDKSPKDGEFSSILVFKTKIRPRSKS